MANSKYEYVRGFEESHRLLPNTWIVIRIDGIGFHNFAAKNQFRKPSDLNALRLMNRCAEEVMKNVHEIVCAFGQSDEFSFILHPDTKLYNRRVEKLVSFFASIFTANYNSRWSTYFDRPIVGLGLFDARAIIYPTLEDLRNYLSWRQVDCHINNLYNTTYNVLLDEGKTPDEAEKILSLTNSSGKNEILFAHGINYNNLEQIYRKGSILVRRKYLHKEAKNTYKQDILLLNQDIIKDYFWTTIIDPFSYKTPS